MGLFDYIRNLHFFMACNGDSSRAVLATLLKSTYLEGVAMRDFNHLKIL